MTKPDRKSYTFFDTDLQLHRLNPDPSLRSAALTEFKTTRPNAMCAFSLVELKGNYIQCLVLLRRKISDSDSLERAYARIIASGGRRSQLMLAQLISWLGGVNFPINPWQEARNALLTHIDAQIEISWEEFQNSVDFVADDFHCSRAAEAPEDDGEKWSATIPYCREGNTNCQIVSFMRRYKTELERLVSTLDKLDSVIFTAELHKINKTANQTIEKNNFPWQGNTCRQVADLLIGLQSKSGKELLSSNYKEHAQMHKPLGYAFREFPMAKLRSK